MRLLLRLFILCVLFSASSIANAADDGNSDSPRGKHTPYHDVDSTLPPTQVVQNASSLLGARVGFGSTTFFGADFEHLFTDNVGGILSARYGWYSADFSAPPLQGTWKYSIWDIAVQGSFHADLFKVQNLDTYVSLGLAHTFVSSSWNANIGGSNPIVSAQGSSWDFVGYVNARYFFASNWSGTVSLGTGLGTFAMGVDYLF